MANKRNYTAGALEELINGVQNSEKPGHTVSGAKKGRPAKHTTPKEKSSEAGLPDELTRATFIVKKELLEKLKGYAFYEGMSLKDTINECLEQYLDGKEIAQRKK